MANQPREISPEIRQFFDEHVEFVVAELPQQVTDFMEQRAALSSRTIRRRRSCGRCGFGIRLNCCGLYTGVPLIKRSVDQIGE